MLHWLHAPSQKAIGKRLVLSWHVILSAMERAVTHGPERRKAELLPPLRVDRKSAPKGNLYVTMVNELTPAHSRVLCVVEDRKRSSLDGYWEMLTLKQTDCIDAVGADMRDPYLTSIQDHLPDGQEKSALDSFHIAGHLGEAVDKVRRTGKKVMVADGDTRLMGTK